MESKIQITLNTGVIGATERQKRTVAALGLRYRESSRVVKETPALRGMVNAVSHLVSAEKISDTLVIPNPFGGTPEYKLGPVPEKKPLPEKKKKPVVSEAKKAEAAEQGGKQEAKAAASKVHAKEAHKPAHKKTDTKAHKKAKKS